MKSRVLIIDDEEEMCWALKKSLQNNDLEVCTATDGAEGLKAFYEQEVNLVLLDVRIKETSGLDILERIRDINADVPVLVMTGYSSMDLAAEAIGKGATGYLTKPIKMSNLRDTVNELLITNKQGKNKLI